MKLLFDLQGLQNESRTRGIGRYVRSLFEALVRRKDIELYALLNESINDTQNEAFEFVRGKLPEDRIYYFPSLDDTRYGSDTGTYRRKFAQASYEIFVAQTGCDALLVGTAVEGFNDDTIISLKMRNSPYIKSVILYDLIPLIDPERYIGWYKTRNWYFDCISHIESADISLAISDSSRSEALQHLKLAPNSSVAISTAIDPTLFNTAGPAGGDILERLNISKPFLMHTSVIEPRKNFDGLVKAFAALPLEVREKHQLLLVGKASPEMEAHLRAIAEASDVPEEDLIIPGFVSDDDLIRLYRACRLFVFPSLHEGFGLPALEAMACGCPAIGSNLTSVPEVIGDPEYTFDPNDTAAMTKMMQRLLTNEKAWRKARNHAVKHAASFSWDRVADRAVVALKAALDGRDRPLPPAYPSAQAMADYVAPVIEMSNCPPEDVEALARCLAAAEDELVATVAAGQPRRGKTWRIEGPFDSSYSLALVNRETARAMAGLGWQVALHSTEGPGDFPANPDFLAANPDLAKMHDRAAKAGNRVNFAVSRLLYPPRVTGMIGRVKALHHYAWEESGFPAEWVDDFNENLTLLTTLSTHVEKIMIDNGVSVPMVTSGCGVDHWDRIAPDSTFRVAARGFRFLHVSSCFPRKGVDALLAAYELAFTIHDDVSLVIKTFDNPHNDLRERLTKLRAKNPRFPDVVVLFADLSDSELKSLYEQCHVMVGPSFAEGYGLPFAEAMLSGIPVITTAWGGQLDFCNPGNSWLVDYQFERAQTHFGLWASVWARAHAPDLARVMREARAASPETRAAMAERGRVQLLARHQWRHVAQRLTAASATLPAQSRTAPRIGWISSWHSKCGIATYSEHLVGAMPGEVTVFSPVNETLLLGSDTSIRIWRQSKADSELWRILTHPAARDLDAFVIQFNYNFYNYGDLSRFIKQAKALGKAIVICLHATIDPPGETNVANFHLAWLAPALAACDRVLVHSIDDLNRLKDLGLIENVALFPHGVLRRTQPAPARSKAAVPTVATYGFALPHKGLPEILHAHKILLDSGRKLKMRLVNAEYPVDFSEALVKHLKQMVQELGLTKHVELHNGFLQDEESLELLTDSDLVVFPYQNTSESASGAVRYGLAVERPVAVTPLSIFNDVEGATFRLDGTSPADLAKGIAAALDAITQGSPEAVSIAGEANRWRDQHDYRNIGRRLFNMCKALASR